MNARPVVLTLLLILSSLSMALGDINTLQLQDSTPVHQAGDTVDCGTNASNVSLEVGSSEAEYNTGDTFEGWADAYCGVWNQSYYIAWGFVFNGETGSFMVNNGTFLFQTNNSSVSYHPTHTDHMNENTVNHYYLTAGNWTLQAHLYVDNGSGGWDSVSAQSEAFTVSTNLSTTACGYDTQQIDLMNSTSSAEILPVGDAWSVWFFVDCPMFTADNNVSYVLTNHNNSSFTPVEWHHNYSLDALWNHCNTYCYMEPDGSGWYYQRMFIYGHNEYSPLPEGLYDFNLTASYYNTSTQSWEVMEEISLTFEVWNASSFPDSGPEVDDAEVDVVVAEEEYTDGESISGSISLTNLVAGEDYIIDYFFNGTGVGSNSLNFTATNESHLEQVVLSSLSPGEYCLGANIYHVDETGWANFLVYDEDCFIVTGTGTSTNEDCDPPAHEDTSNLTVTLDQSAYDENETMIITLTMTCPATNGDRMYVTVWVEDENGLVGSAIDDVWDSSSDETVVYTYNTTAYTGSGTGEYTLYAEYYGDVLADFDFLDDDTVSFTVGEVPDSELCVVLDAEGNEVENLVFGAAGYNVSDYTENNNVTYGLPYQADIMTLCSATGGAVNQIQYWIEAEATGETTNVTYVEWTSTDGAGYEFMIQESAVIDMGPGIYILYTEYYVALDGMNFEFVDDDVDMVVFEVVDTDDNENIEPQLNCSELDTSGIDGEILIFNVSASYDEDDAVLAYIDVCWTPTNVTMWYTVTLNHTSSGTTVEGWEAQGVANFPTWWYALEHDEGHVTFPMDQHYGVANAWDLQVSSLPYSGEYCFNAHLKVFDDTNGGFHFMDEDGPVCFDVVLTNNENDGENESEGNEAGENATSDADGDGVADADDQCPDTPVGATVDATGCVPVDNSWNNVPPVVSAVIISPNLPMADEALTCAFMAFDADDDEVTTTLEWKVNGNVIAADVDTIDSGYSAGDDVMCTVVGWDGQTYGNTDADSVTILPSPDDVETAAQGLPALGTIGTLVAIAFGVGLTRRQDD